MTSYLSNLLTNTTSRYNNLRRSLLSDESDGDTEDDTHISRVLRAYYVEKGRPFPPWLPPDPKSTAPSQFPQAISRPPPTPQRRGGALSDLWDSPGQQQQQQGPQSLRRSGEGMRATPPGQRPAMGGPSDSYASSQRLQPTGSRPMPGDRSQPQASSRPLSSRDDGLTPQSSAGQGSVSSTAQDRLKQKLWGGRSNSPSAGQSTNPYGR